MRKVKLNVIQGIGCVQLMRRHSPTCDRRCSTSMLPSLVT